MTLLEKTEDFVQNLFKDKLSEAFLYHNFNHTLSVVNSVKLIIKELKLSSEESEQLLLAAWFHDTGYVEGYEDHENKSIKIAVDFLHTKGKSEEFIALVSSLILATAKENKSDLYFASDLITFVVRNN